MHVYETYSKRLQKQKHAGQSDVYQYEEFSEKLRAQIIHIWNDAIGESGSTHTRRQPEKVWRQIRNVMVRESGQFFLWEYGITAKADCRLFLLNHRDVLDGLDLTEIAFRVIESLSPSYVSEYCAYSSATDAIDELNYRFLENGVGFQFVDGQIIRVDSQYIHSEVVKPALQMLHTGGFEGAADEFLNAHAQYRRGEHADSISNALKAFESTMKTICDKKGWSYKSSDTAKQLIKVCLDNKLIPKYMETHLAGVRNTLEAGLPTVRNKEGGHGQGTERKDIPTHIASYALHLAATNIVFMVEAADL